MAPVEFERKIKEKLEERRIKPSADSWDRVEARLSTPERKKPGYWSYAVAAALAVVFFSGLWIVRETSTDQMSVDAVVEEDTSPAVQDEQRPMPDNSNIGRTVVVSDSADDTKQLSEKSTPEAQQVVVSEEPLINLEQDRDILGYRSTEDIDPLIDEKLKEVVAQVRILEENKDSVTDAEVDLLLDTARQELLAEVNFRDNGSVDHQLLLSGVETEIDKTFRDQVFEKLKQGFVKVRTAVALRNN